MCLLFVTNIRPGSWIGQRKILVLLKVSYTRLVCVRGTLYILGRVRGCGGFSVTPFLWR
jgi:hypothetical protein